MKPLTIVGGGLAGLALGIALRKHNVPVTIFEAGRYPRHRVCGEFISGRGVKLMADLRIEETYRANAVAFFSGSRIAGRHCLPTPAICISRFTLDAALAEQFSAADGNLIEGRRWKETGSAEGVIWATGRRAHPVEGGSRWFGLKVHARNVELEADLEMHLGENAYVGLCRLPGDEVNVCGLFRRRVGDDTVPVTGMELLRGVPGSQLFARLESARFVDGSFCAVAGLSLLPKPIDGRECRIGDALTMIPPITGNGMSMAFESAHLATEPLCRYARGAASWEDTKSEIARALRQAFSRRLRWAALLHQMIFSPGGTRMLPLLFRIAPLWRSSFNVTR